MFLIFVLNAFWAVTFALGKSCLFFVPPISFIGVRMMIAGTLLLAYSYFKEKAPLTFRKTDFWWFAGIIFFQIYIAFVGEFIGLKSLPASKVALLFNLTPFITAVIAYFLFKEIFTLKKIAGLTVGFLGILPVLFDTEGTAVSFFTMSTADIITLVAVTSACLGWIFLQKLTRDLHYSFFYVNGLSMVVGGIFAYLTGIFLEPQPDYLTVFANPTFLKSFISLMIIGNVICFNLYGYLLKHYTATIISFFGFFIPLFSAFFDWLFFGQVFDSNFYISVGIVTVGLYLYYQEELKQGYIVH